jgi:DNA-binding transcriptional regulator YiaG
VKHPPSVQVVHGQESSSHASKVVTLLRCAPGDLRVSAERAARAEFVTFRHELGFTQVEAAKQIGCSKSSVEDWERGAVTVPGWAPKALKLLLDARSARRAA